MSDIIEWLPDQAGTLENTDVELRLDAPTASPFKELLAFCFAK